MKETVIIVTAHHWHQVLHEDGQWWDTIYKESKIMKVFHNLPDALDYMNSFPDRHAPGNPYQDTGYNELSGFYLEQSQFEVE